MLSKKINEALNNQLKSELYASHLYLSMAAFCESINLPGFARWMMQQSSEERTHALKIFNYINNRDGRVTLQSVDQPPATFKSAVDMFQQALEHEKSVSEAVHKLYRLASEESDYPTEVELQWFITEQVEEEKTASDIVQKLKMVGEQPTALLMLDHHLGARQG